MFRICLSFLFATTVVNAEMLPVPQRLLKALHMVETGGREGAIVGDNGQALGPYQIHKAYWIDAANFDSSLGDNYLSVTNKAYAERVITAYFNRYGKYQLMSGHLEGLARLHNGGPTWMRKKHLTDNYWRKVKSFLDKQK